jgi:hypothetical protein
MEESGKAVQQWAHPIREENLSNPQGFVTRLVQDLRSGGSTVRDTAAQRIRRRSFHNRLELARKNRSRCSVAFGDD